MKKNFLLLISCLLATFSATADNYFTVVGAVNDTLLINPTDLNGYTSITFCAHFDGYLDNWRLELTYPHDTIMEYARVHRGSDMYIPYIKSDGTEDIYEAALTITPQYNSNTYDGEMIVSSTINEYGYWDYNHDGIYEPYGTIKWNPGDHDDFFTIYYFLYADCTGDSITIDGYLTSTPDSRGYVVSSALFYRVIYLKVGYQRGDVNGDGQVTIDDVTALMNYLLSQEGLDQYQLEAADVNRDGSVTISDATALVNLLISLGAMNVEDLQAFVDQLMLNGGQGVYYAPDVQAGIDELLSLSHRSMDPNYYNLMGQRVGTEFPSTPGIYIHQGKKIIVR